MLYYIATSVKYSQNRYAAEVAVYVHMLLDLSATLIKKTTGNTRITAKHRKHKDHRKHTRTQETLQHMKTHEKQVYNNDACPGPQSSSLGFKLRWDGKISTGVKLTSFCTATCKCSKSHTCHNANAMA
jgi:hypothetical protein